jgi:hypothetical protein
MPTASPTPAPAVPGVITGRVLRDGNPVDGRVTLTLEDENYDLVGETRVDAEGFYTFDDVPVSGAGYNVLFGQEWNEAFPVDQVITWGWIGPVVMESEAVIELPDLDISLLGFEPVYPEPSASFSAQALSSQTPIVFEWAAYPGATSYWADLMVGEELETVWQSSYVNATSVSFDGTLSGGEPIEPGEYWWGVGAQRTSGAYTLTVYGYLPPLTIEP